MSSAYPVRMARSDPQPANAGAPVRLTAAIRGQVQGVGFRWWARCRALELGLVGTVTNLDDGRVELVAEGSRNGCDQLLELLTEQPPRQPPPGAARSYYRRPGRVAGVTHWFSPATGGITGFREA